MNNPRPIVLGFYSPSQNGTIVSPLGIAPCLVGGGKRKGKKNKNYIIIKEGVNVGVFKYYIVIFNLCCII